MVYLERPSWLILFMLFPLFILLRKAGFFPAAGFSPDFGKLGRADPFMAFSVYPDCPSGRHSRGCNCFFSCNPCPLRSGAAYQ